MQVAIVKYRTDDNSKISKLAADSLNKDYNRIKDKYPKQTAAVEKYIAQLSAAEKAREKEAKARKIAAKLAAKEAKKAK